jgi:putative membrane protein
MIGLFSIWIAAGSSIASLDDELLSFQMLQHCLLMAVGPPLVLLAAPVLPFRHGLPQRIVHDVLDPLPRCSPVWSLGRLLTHPVFCWLTYTITVIGWHVPVLFELHWWHETQRASFFAAGLLLWM